MSGSFMVKMFMILDGGACGVMVIIIENEYNRVQILQEIFCISHCTNNFCI